MARWSISPSIWRRVVKSVTTPAGMDRTIGRGRRSRVPRRRSSTLAHKSAVTSTRPTSPSSTTRRRAVTASGPGRATTVAGPANRKPSASGGEETTTRRAISGRPRGHVHAHELAAPARGDPRQDRAQPDGLGLHGGHVPRDRADAQRVPRPGRGEPVQAGQGRGGLHGGGGGRGGGAQ